MIIGILLEIAVVFVSTLRVTRENKSSVKEIEPAKNNCDKVEVVTNKTSKNLEEVKAGAKENNSVDLSTKKKTMKNSEEVKQDVAATGGSDAKNAKKIAAA